MTKVMRPLSCAFRWLHLWTVMILFGAILFETLILYPNIFHQVPRSLENAMAFLVVGGPHDFFPPVGMAALLTGIGVLIFNWRVQPVRYWLLAGLLLLLAGEFLFSMIYFWPRNTIMFEEGTALHSVATLEQVAIEFQRGHWFRVLGCFAVAACSLKAFLLVDRREHGLP